MRVLEKLPFRGCTQVRPTSDGFVCTAPPGLDGVNRDATDTSTRLDASDTSVSGVAPLSKGEFRVVIQDRSFEIAQFG